MTTSRLFLLDGSGYIYRAFYATPPLTRRDGFPTNAVFGFIKMLRRLIEEHRPELLAVVFDARGPTFRHHLDATYKAQRKPMPDELRSQVPFIQEATSALGVPRFELVGFEADDVLGTLADRAAAAGYDVVIVTGDKDLMQLVNDRIRLLDAAKGAWTGPAEVVERWGVPADQLIQVMGLCGDDSDNIPGVPGIGPKTAAQLIQQFGDVETLLAQAHTIPQPKRRQSLLEFAEQARLSLQLVTIDRQVPIPPFALEDLQRRPPEAERLLALCRELEFTSLLREFQRLLPQESPAAAAPPAADPAAFSLTPPWEEPPVAPPAPLVGEPGGGGDYRAIVVEADFAALLQQLAGLSGWSGFSVDTETTSVDPTRADLVGISLAWEPRKAVYIPVGHTAEAAPGGQLPLAWVLEGLRPFLEDPAMAKTGQNLKYEVAVFARHGVALAGIQRDSMILSHLLHGSTRRHNLDAIAQDELGRTTITYKEVTGTGKSQLRFDQVPLERAVPYACEDAEVAWEAAERLEARLREIPELHALYQSVELPLLPILAEMEGVGALVDRETLAGLSTLFAGRRKILEERIHALAGETFNVNSTQQLGDILFNKLGIKSGKKTKTGFSTDVEVLTRLAEEGHEIPAQVLEYRTLTKLQSTYTDALMALIHPESGRIHTSFNQAVTLTGRLSSSDPNLQNIPVRSEEGRAIRRAFVAPPGWVLLSADYSQIELRLLAHLGEVERLRWAFSQDLDVHAATAGELFGVDPRSVTSEQRRMAKTINFGLIYGMSPFGLARRLGIPQYEAKKYMEAYFTRYEGVQEYMMKAVADARMRGYARTLAGRRCYLPEIESSNRALRENAERAAINAPLQGSAADLIKRAMIRLAADLRHGGFRSRMILQVHDELVLEVLEAELEEVRSVVRRAMEGVMALSVPLRVDVGVAGNWAEAH
ncbi:MAG: DNA polymerase I [Magnetococcales bacterium]|nr:DNA polymerase I [Magnetococcales bacterium]